MRKLTLILMIIILSSSLFSQNFSNNGKILTLDGLSYASDILNEIVFNNGEMKFIRYEGWFEQKEIIVFQDKYSIEYNNGLPFIILENEQKKFLCIANDEILLLYKENQKDPYFFGYYSMSGLETIYQSALITASSELTENGYGYTASNLCNFNLGEPWVEGVTGNGEGESFEVEGNCTYIYIFNGYISYNKPYLYERNSRLKKIQITFPNNPNHKELIFDLLDTPNPQKINLGERYTETIKLEILEVYPGTKYQDTCVNALLFQVF